MSNKCSTVVTFRVKELSDLNLIIDRYFDPENQNSTGNTATTQILSKGTDWFPISEIKRGDNGSPFTTRVGVDLTRRYYISSNAHEKSYHEKVQNYASNLDKSIKGKLPIKCLNINPVSKEPMFNTDPASVYTEGERELSVKDLTDSIKDMISRGTLTEEESTKFKDLFSMKHFTNEVLNTFLLLEHYHCDSIIPMFSQRILAGSIEDYIYYVEHINQGNELFSTKLQEMNYAVSFFEYHYYGYKKVEDGYECYFVFLEPWRPNIEWYQTIKNTVKGIQITGEYHEPGCLLAGEILDDDETVSLTVMSSEEYEAKYPPLK